jgi:DNA-directed RNA polymerase subunit RPC12/RpoP
MKAKSEDVEDEFEEEELKEKRKEMRKLKMEKEMLKLQAEAEKARQEVEKLRVSPAAPSTNPDSQAAALGAVTASLIKAGVKPEQASEFFSKMNPEALAVLASLTSNNPYLPVFMFLASQSKGQNPQSMTPKDIIELNKSVYELARDIGGKGKSEGETVTVIKTLADLARDAYNKQLLDKLDEVKDAVGVRTSIWEEILEDGSKFQRFKELFGGSSAKPEIQIELEKLRQQHEINMKKLDLEMLKLRSEILEGRRKAKMFSQALKKIGEAVGEGIGEAAEEETPKATAPLQYKPETVKCPKCGADIVGVSPGAEVECPSCKTRYLVHVK